jgi:hypothetical protein
MATEEVDFEKLRDESKERIKGKFDSFSKLLNDIETIEDKKKTLWKEIYENSVTDRENAYIMFMKLYQTVSNDAAQHAIHGATIVKYLERMSRANDQLTKLAELLQAADTKDGKIDTEDLFRKIEGK